MLRSISNVCITQRGHSWALATTCCLSGGPSASLLLQSRPKRCGSPMSLILSGGTALAQITNEGEIVQFPPLSKPWLYLCLVKRLLKALL